MYSVAPRSILLYIFLSGVLPTIPSGCSALPLLALHPAVMATASQTSIVGPESEKDVPPATVKSNAMDIDRPEDKLPAVAPVEIDYEDLALRELWSRGNNNPSKFRLKYPEFKAWLTTPPEVAAPRKTVCPYFPVPPAVMEALYDNHPNSYYWYNSPNLGCSLPISTHPCLVRHYIALIIPLSANTRLLRFARTTIDAPWTISCMSPCPGSIPTLHSDSQTLRSSSAKRKS